MKDELIFIMLTHFSRDMWSRTKWREELAEYLHAEQRREEPRSDAEELAPRYLVYLIFPILIANAVKPGKGIVGRSVGVCHQYSSVKYSFHYTTNERTLLARWTDWASR